MLQRERYGPCNPNTRNGSQQGTWLHFDYSPGNDIIHLRTVGLCDPSKWTVFDSSSTQRFTLTRSSRATCWWTREVRMEQSSMATGSYRSPFSLKVCWLNKTVKPQLGNDKPFVCSPKPSVSHMHWCTAMRWRWERLCCPSISTLGLIPVMAVSLVRWWLTSASTGGRRRQVRHQWYIDSKFVKAGLNSAICIFYS